MCPPKYDCYVLEETLESRLLKALAADCQTRPQLNLLLYIRLESGVKIKIHLIGSITQTIYDNDFKKSMPYILLYKAYSVAPECNGIQGGVSKYGLYPGQVQRS